MDTHSNHRCIACERQQSEVVFNEFGIDIVRCKCCGHMSSMYPGDQNYDGYFGEQQIEQQDQGWWDDAHRAMYDDFCQRFITRNTGTLLDVGCGLGYFVKKMSEMPGWDAYGCEISRVAVEYGRSRLGLKNISNGKIEEIDFGNRTFDIITLWDVIEHIPNPDPFLARLYKLLKPGGILFLHTPNALVQLPKARLKRLFMGMDQRAHYLEAKDHINLYTSESIATVLGRKGYGTVRFLHLKPIQQFSDSNSALFVILKNLWASFSGMLYSVSKDRLNIGNLFVVAQKNQ